MSNDRTVPAAYRDTGAASIACPHCGAPAGAVCVKPDGRPSRMPCVARIAGADLTPAARCRRDTPDRPQLDFTEPRRKDTPA